MSMGRAFPRAPSDRENFSSQRHGSGALRVARDPGGAGDLDQGLGLNDFDCETRTGARGWGLRL